MNKKTNVLHSKKTDVSLKENSHIPIQTCPQCGKKISALPGTRDAICQNCGYKDPCCE